jgi:hypothetical protein
MCKIVSRREAAESHLGLGGSGAGGVSRGTCHAWPPHVFENTRFSAAFQRVTNFNIVNPPSLSHNKMVNGTFGSSDTQQSILEYML